MNSKNLVPLFVLGASLVLPLVDAKPESYAVWAADSAIARGQGNGYVDGEIKVSYEHGEFWYALQQLYDVTGNETYIDYIEESANVIVNDDGELAEYYSIEDYQLDPIRTGPALLYLYEKTGDEKWLTAASTFREQLDSHPRTEEGQFWHKKTYPNQGWLDGIYMGDIFYAVYTEEYDNSNSTAWDDIVAQFQLIYDNTLQLPDSLNASTGEVYTGLLYHGYDYSHTASWASDDRGHSTEIWDRALGWYIMSLADMLEVAPAAYKDIFVQHLQDLAPKIIDAADDECGVWWLVMSQPDREGNYFESSGAVMFIYGILKGIRLGALDDSDGSLVAGVTKAYEYIVDNWVAENDDGTMNWLDTVSVGSLSGDGSFEYYISVDTVDNDLKGLAAFVMASVEFEQL